MSKDISTRTRGRIVITRRDLELLLSLFQYRFLSLPQVERLHFPSAQTAARRLRLLARAGLVTVVRMPGITDRIASLTGPGIDQLSAMLKVPAAELGRSRARFRPKDHLFLRHALAVSDFRIALEAAASARPDTFVRGFYADHVVERTDSGGFTRFTRDLAAGVAGPGATVGHTPDGVFALTCGTASALFFLEVDRGTETVSDRERGVAKILRFYLSYIGSGGYRRYENVFQVSDPFAAVRVLVATSSARRLQTIRKVGASLGFEPRLALQFIWLTEIRSVTEHTIFDQIWVPLDPAVKTTFGIIPKRDPSSSDTRECVGS